MRTLFKLAIGAAVLAGISIGAAAIFAKPFDPLMVEADETCDLPAKQFVAREKKFGWSIVVMPLDKSTKLIADFRAAVAAAGGQVHFPDSDGEYDVVAVSSGADGLSYGGAIVKDGCVIAHAQLDQAWFEYWAGVGPMPKLEAPGEGS